MFALWFIIWILDLRKEIMMKEETKTQLLPAILISIAINFMLFIYSPLELLFNNKSSFWYDVYKLFPVIFTFFIIVSMCISLVFVLVYNYIPNFFLWQGEP